MDRIFTRERARRSQKSGFALRLPVGLAMVIASFAAVPGLTEVITVSPGALVRWPGEGIGECGKDERRWQPLRGECWYAIDLLTPAGQIALARWREGVEEVRQVQIGAYPYEVQYITLEDDSQVSLSTEDLRRVQRENGKIAALWPRESPRQFTLPLGPPLASLPDGGRFGSRRFFNNQPRSPHTGSDFAAGAGTQILSVAAGTVALTGDFFFPGKSVFVDHGDGLISMYFHMSGIAVDDGDEVGRGEILGLVGQSGRTTGPHLHFGIRWHGARVDPELLLGPPEALIAIP